MTTFEFITAVTHDGIFHADDVFAAGMLRILSPGVRILRTRKPDAVVAADVVFDVGGVYDPAKRRFDHHQREGAPAPRGNGVKFSSAGLLWEELGEEILRRVVAGIDLQFAAYFNYAVGAEKLDQFLIRQVDARDNGDLNVTASTKGGVDVSVTVLSDVIAAFNTTPLVDSEDQALMDERFEEAVSFAELFLRKRIAQEFARQKGEAIIAKAILDSNGGAVVVLDPFILGWQEAVVRNAPNAKFVVHPKLGGGWQAATVPVESGKFEARKLPPREWWGAKTADLVAATGVPDVIFCHQGGAFFAAKSREGLDRLIEIALQT